MLALQAAVTSVNENSRHTGRRHQAELFRGSFFFLRSGPTIKWFYSRHLFESPFYFCEAAYLFGGFLLLCIYVCFPKTLAKFDHSPINNECHGSILLLVLIEEQQSTPANRNTRSCAETQILDSCDDLTDSESR